MKNILKNYRRRLLNLSAGNRSLLLLRLSQELHLDMEALDFIAGEPAFSVIEKLIAGKRHIPLSPVADSRYAPVAPVSKRLRYIKRRTDMLFEERGSHELYLGWPFVQGMLADGTVVRCPLLMFPVQLQLNSAQQWELLPDETQAPQFNQSFLLAYAHYTGTPLSENLLELDLSTLPTHPLEFRTQLYELLKAEQLAVHVGRDFFADKLKPFRDYKKAAYEATLKPGQLYLEPHAVLGIYPQTGSYLLNDYDALLEQHELQTMEDLFVAPTIGNQVTQAQHTFTVFPIDASQEAALQQVKEGCSLVIQGPPGTGKSQLICNLVSDFTARGKKVLVVSQKRAALDVVHKRLSEAGLGAFAALVHDINSDRKSVFEQLRLQIEHVDAFKKQNLALNSIYNERCFLEVSRGINRCVQQLGAFKTALFDTSRCGWSAKELYLRSSLQQPFISLSDIYSLFTAETLPAFLPKLRQYLRQALIYEQKSFVWKDRYSMKGFGWPQRHELEQTITQLPEQYIALEKQLQKLSGFLVDEVGKYCTASATIDQLLAILETEGVLSMIQPLLRHKADARRLNVHVQQLKELYLVCPTPDAAIPQETIVATKNAIVAYGQHRGHILKTINWEFSKDKKVLKKALANYRLELNEQGVAELGRRLQLRHQAETLMQAINQTLHVGLNISDYPTQVLQKLQLVAQTLQAYNLLKKLHHDQILHQKLWLTIPLTEHLLNLQQTINQWQYNYKLWLTWLPESQIKKLVTDTNYKQQLMESLSANFEKLVAYDSLYSTFTKVEREAINLLLAQPVTSEKEGEALFLNSLYLAWLHNLESQQPELRMPSNGELKQLEDQLQELLQQKQQLSSEIVLTNLREQTYNRMEFNRLGNAVTYRRLLAQVTKKRSLYPLRKLFNLFSEEILNLVPCWLASPETVSAMLPLERCFDLVIFDEASQCYAETGIPAMMRARQAVVAGDEQQLKPSDLYRARWSSTADDETEELTAESLLQLCGLYLPQIMLTQHYRSHYPELIAFSDKHFYRNKLEMIPDMHELNKQQPAITFVPVNGLWQQNANLPEAQKVVETTWQLLEQGISDIGIITFNYNQQMLVQDLLEEKALTTNYKLPDTLLVKNIENMQGDEKDVIILSVGYAPNENGKLTMQFGSLNHSGGENRLNVAITRARRRIIVVSSIKPEHLQVSHTLHLGPKLLKEYLSYAQQVSNGGFTYQPKKVEIPGNVPLLKTILSENIVNLQPLVPFADLTVLENNNYKGVVLTDDDMYYNHLSVRHTHADMPQLLQKRHWSFKKVYSRQFWADREGALKQLANNHTTV